MSWFRPRRGRLTAPNQAKPRRSGRVAQGMLDPGAMVLLLTLTASLGAVSSGCLLPPDLEAGRDSGPGAPPVILSAGPAPEFAFPGPMILERQDPRTLSLTVEDRDRDDVLHVRLYVDYHLEPSPAYAECQAASTGEDTRVIACPVNSLCTPIEPSDRDAHVLEAMVADRAFIANSDPAAADQPLFRALRDPGRASYSFRSWVLSCNPPDDL